MTTRMMFARVGVVFLTGLTGLTGLRKGREHEDGYEIRIRDDVWAICRMVLHLGGVFVAVVVSCLFAQLDWLVKVSFFVLVVTALTYLAGSFIILAERQYRRALWHFLLGFVGLFLFMLVAVSSMKVGHWLYRSM